MEKLEARSNGFRLRFRDLLRNDYAVQFQMCFISPWNCLDQGCPREPTLQHYDPSSVMRPKDNCNLKKEPNLRSRLTSAGDKIYFWLHIALCTYLFQYFWQTWRGISRTGHDFVLRATGAAWQNFNRTPIPNLRGLLYAVRCDCRRSISVWKLSLLNLLARTNFSWFVSARWWTGVYIWWLKLVRRLSWNEGAWLSGWATRIWGFSTWSVIVLTYSNLMTRDTRGPCFL